MPARTTPSVTVPSAGWAGSSGTVSVPQSVRSTRSVGTGTSRPPSELGVQSLSGRVARPASGTGSGTGAPGGAGGAGGRSARTATGGRVDGPTVQLASSPTASRTAPSTRRRATRLTVQEGRCGDGEPGDRVEPHSRQVGTGTGCGSRRSTPAYATRGVGCGRSSSSRTATGSEGRSSDARAVANTSSCSRASTARTSASSASQSVTRSAGAAADPTSRARALATPGSVSAWLATASPAAAELTRIVVSAPPFSTTSGRGSGRTERATQVSPNTADSTPPTMATTRQSSGWAATVSRMIGSSNGRPARATPNTPYDSSVTPTPTRSSTSPMSTVSHRSPPAERATAERDRRRTRGSTGAGGSALLLMFLL